MSNYYQSARDFSKIASINNQNKNCNSHVIVTGGWQELWKPLIEMHLKQIVSL